MKKTYHRLMNQYKQYKARHKHDGMPKPPEVLPPLSEDATRAEKIKMKMKVWRNRMRLYMATGTEQGNLFVIFLLALTHGLAGVGHFIVLPVAIAASGISSALYARHAYLSGHRDRGAMADAALNITVSLVLTAGIIMAFIGTGALATVAPALITGGLGLKALFDLGAAVICYAKYHKHKEKNPAKSDMYYDQAKEYIVGFVTEALLAGAAAGVLIANKSAFGAMGIVGGVIGGTYAAHKGYKTYKAYKAAKAEYARALVEQNATKDINPELALNNELTNNAQLLQALGLEAQHDGAQQTVTNENSAVVVPAENTTRFVSMENNTRAETNTLTQVGMYRSAANAINIEDAPNSTPAPRQASLS